MPKTNRTLTYGGETIPFHLQYSKRKSLEIAVHPDGSVVVKAPLGSDEILIQAFLYQAHALDKTPASLFRPV